MKFLFCLMILFPSYSYALDKTGECSGSEIINFDTGIKTDINFTSLSISQDNFIFKNQDDTLVLNVDKTRFDYKIKSIISNNVYYNAVGICILQSNHTLCSISVFDENRIKYTIHLNFVEFE